MTDGRTEREMDGRSRSLTVSITNMPNYNNLNLDINNCLGQACEFTLLVRQQYPVINYYKPCE